MINYIFFAISGLLAVALTVALAKRISAIQREKNNALAQLRHANDDLENRVNARTAELTATNDALKQRLDELSTLNLIVQTAATVTDLDSALEIIAGTLTRLLNASGCMVALLNDERTQLTVTIDFSRNPHRSNRVGQCIPVTEYLPVQQVLKNGRSVVISPAAQVEQAETAAPDRFRLLVPLLSRGKVIGAIDVAAAEPGHQFSTAEVSLAETVAAQVAGAVANTRLFERQRSTNLKIQQRNRELAVINRASQVFNSTLKLDELLQTILDEVNHLLNIVGTSFWLYEPATDELVCRQATGSAREKIIGWRLQPGEGVTGQAAQSGQSLIVPDTHQDTRHYKGVDQETKLEIRSLACIPLLSKGRVIGVLNMSDVEVGRFTTDDLKLLEPVAAVAAGAIENARLFDAVEQARRRMFDELTLAREIQQGLLPPPQPNWPDLDVACFTAAAREIGGDFYRYHRFTPTGSLINKFAFAVGDVTGKGVSAALLMAASLAQFDASLSQELSPPERMVYLDNAIAPYTKPRRQNCAFCFAELGLAGDNAVLQVVNAGCIPPYIKYANGRVEQPDVGGFALGQGLAADISYPEHKQMLSEGDLVVFTSDGVVEANNPNHQMLGFDRLQNIVETGPNSSATAMLAHVKQAVLHFTQGAEQHDDFTIVVVGL